MRTISMMGLVRSLTIAAAATLFLAAPGERARAMSLISPGASPAANAATDGLIQVRGGGHGGGSGHGGGGFHGGGFHGGGFHGGGFHGGGFHAFHGGGGWHGGGWHGGGFRYGGFHHFGGYRFAHFHRRHFYGGYHPYYYYPHHCRIIWTYYGPRRVCGWHHWHRWHRHYW